MVVQIANFAEKENLRKRIKLIRNPLTLHYSPSSICISRALDPVHHAKPLCFQHQ